MRIWMRLQRTSTAQGLRFRLLQVLGDLDLRDLLALLVLLDSTEGKMAAHSHGLIS